MRNLVLCACLALVCVAGCASVDPKTVNDIDVTEKQLAPRSFSRIDADVAAGKLTASAADSEKKLWKSLEDLIRSLKDAVK